MAANQDPFSDPIPVAVAGSESSTATKSHPLDLTAAQARMRGSEVRLEDPVEKGPVMFPSSLARYPVNPKPRSNWPLRTGTQEQYQKMAESLMEKVEARVGKRPEFSRDPQEIIAAIDNEENKFRFGNYERRRDHVRQESTQIQSELIRMDQEENSRQGDLRALQAERDRLQSELGENDGGFRGLVNWSDNRKRKDRIAEIDNEVSDLEGQSKFYNQRRSDLQSRLDKNEQIWNEPPPEPFSWENESRGIALDGATEDQVVLMEAEVGANGTRLESLEAIPMESIDTVHISDSDKSMSTISPLSNIGRSVALSRETAQKVDERAPAHVRRRSVTYDLDDHI